MASLAPPLPDTPSRAATIKAALAFFAIVVAAAMIGSAAPSGDENPWWVALNKPPINPPSIVFPIVWTPLYAAMAVSMLMVWRAGRGRLFPIGSALAIWLLQLGLNVAWSWVFFGMREPMAALAVIVLLWLAIAAMIGTFWRWSPAAAWLQAPYLAWVSFATLLNAWFVAIN